MFDSLLGYQDIKVVNGKEIKTKRAYLVKDNPTDAQLQYNGTWITGLNVAKMKYYGNQSSLWIGEIDTADAAHINSI